MKRVRLLTFTPSASLELSEITKGSFGSSVLPVLLSGLGVVAIGGDLHKAFRNTDRTDDAAQIEFDEILSEKLTTQRLRESDISRRILSARRPSPTPPKLQAA